ncbi:MAG: hypothetical protein ACXVCP_06510 [Bdellovibrio sp.]
MRIFFITLATVIVVGVLILMARIWGLGQTFQAYEHPFFNQAPVTVVKTETIEKAEQILKLNPQAALWLDVRISKDKTVFVLSSTHDKEFLDLKRKEQEQNPSVPIMTGIKLSEYSWNDLKSFYKDSSLLKDFYSKFPNTRFVLNVVDNASEVHVAVVNAIKDLKPDSRTLLQSDALVIMTTTKELKPEWLYGTSVPDIVRLLTFDSMWILPSTQFKGDVFLAPFKIKNRPAFNDDIISEMRRRKKRVVLGPIRTKEEMAETIRMKADGYITEDLPQLMQLLGQGPTQ